MTTNDLSRTTLPLAQEVQAAAKGQRALAAYRRVIEGHAGHGAVPPLWDGHAAERIVAILRRGRF